MSVNTAAILFYGYCWDDEERLFPGVDEDQEWEEILLARRGTKDPWDDCPKDPGGAMADEWVRVHEEEIDAYHDAREAVTEEFRVWVGQRASDECPSPFVAAWNSVVRARRGYPEEIRSLDVGEGWDDDLKRFLDGFSLMPPQDRPRWWLVSDWG